MSIDSHVPEENKPTEPTAPAAEPVKEELTPAEPVIEEKPEETPVNPTEAALAAMGDIKTYKRGEMVKGTIVQVTDDSLVVDIGTKTEGIIRREEIGIGPNPDLSVFSVGDPVSAVVVNEDDEGTYHLSKRRADQMLVWDEVDESLKKGTRMKAVGFRAVKGGLLVDIGTIAFLPQSLVDIKRVDDLDPYVGQKFEVRVVEYDRDAKPHPKIVVSRRGVLEEDLTKERDEIYDKLDQNAVIDGKVVKLTNYGAFVDIGGIQGLLHISEMSLGRIKHPSEVMKEGDTIKVKLLKIDKKKKRISLGRRDLLPNPWESIRDKFKPGTVVEGTVVRTADFGAFIKLDDYFEGLAHISELVDNKISHAKEVFSPGDKVNVLIMNIDRKNKRIKLSIRRAAEAQRKAEVDQYMKAQGDLGNVFANQLQAALEDADLPLKDDEKPREAEKPAETAATEIPEAEKPAEEPEKPAEPEVSVEPETTEVTPEEAPMEPEVKEEAEAVTEEPAAEAAPSEEAPAIETPAETPEETPAETPVETPAETPAEPSEDAGTTELNGTPL